MPINPVGKNKKKDLMIANRNIHHPLRMYSGLGDITHPLLCVADFLPADAKTGLQTLIGELEAQRKQDQAETLPGQIAAALYDLQNDVSNDKIPVERLRQQLIDNAKICPSAQAIGRELTAMGIKRRKSMGKMHIIWDQVSIEKFWERYGVLA